MNTELSKVLSLVWSNKDTGNLMELVVLLSVLKTLPDLSLLPSTGNSA